MSAEDLEKYETEMELQLYREYRDIVRQFSYVNVAAVSGRGNRPPRARRPRAVISAAAAEAEPMMLWPAAEGTVGVASGEPPRPPVPVGEDEGMEGEKR